jgi:hypothetical protein
VRRQPPSSDPPDLPEQPAGHALCQPQQDSFRSDVRLQGGVPRSSNVVVMMTSQKPALLLHKRMSR